MSKPQRANYVSRAVMDRYQDRMAGRLEKMYTRLQKLERTVAEQAKLLATQEAEVKQLRAYVLQKQSPFPVKVEE